jgi:hypothetical protein
MAENMEGVILNKQTDGQYKLMINHDKIRAELRKTKLTDILVHSQSAANLIGCLYRSRLFNCYMYDVRFCRKIECSGLHIH